MLCGKLWPEEIKRITHMQRVAARGVFGHQLDAAMAIAHLAHRSGAGVLIEQQTDPAQERDIFRLALGVFMLLHVIGIDRVGQMLVARPVGRVGTQFAVVEIIIDGVEPKPVNAALQPETHDIEHGILHVRIVEVQVGLAGEEIVQVILPARRVPFPGSPAKHRRPVIGRRAIGQGIGPHVPVSLAVGAVEPRFFEIGVLVGGVADHLVHDHLDATGMRLGHKAVKIVQGAEQPVHFAIVGDVIAHIGLRRLGDGRQPDAIHSQAGDVIEPPDNAGQVANAVAIAVLK